MNDQGADEQEKVKFHLCPMCRFVFKYSSVETETAVVCPSCNFLVRIDTENKSVVKSSDELIKGYQRQKELEWESETDDVPEHEGVMVKWGLNILAVTIVFGLGLMVWWWMKPSQQSEVANITEDQAEIEISSKNEAELFKQAKQVLQTYLKSKTAEQALIAVDIEGISEEAFKKFYKPVQFGSVLSNGEFLQDSSYLKFEVKYDGGIRAGYMRVVGESAKLDWKSWSGYNPSTVDQLVKKESSQKLTIRCFCSYDNNYDLFYPEEEWQSLKISFPHQGGVYYAYVKRSDKDILEKIRKAGVLGSAKRISLTIQPIPDKKLRVVDFISDSWLITQ